MERHDFDLVSFLFGLLFTGIVVAYLLSDGGFDPDLGDWFWPIVLVVAGIVVLASAVARPGGPDRSEDGPSAPSDSFRDR
jgi:branched-subunit amino acid permease